MLKFNEQHEKDARAKRLKLARNAAGFTSGEKAAQRFHWNVNSYKAHESGRNGFGIADAKRYAHAFGVSTAWLQTGQGDEPEQRATRNNLVTSTASIGMVRVTGKVAANSWLSVDDMDFGYDDIHQVPSVGGYPLEWQFGLIVEGNCLNKIAQNGDLLVCLNTIAAGIELEPGDLAIVERKRFGGQMVMRTAKRVRQTADGFELWPESTDPQHQKPIKLYQAPEDEDIQVVGKVLWILRKP